MAPKKTLLPLTLILFASLTAAESINITEEDVPEEVWLNEYDNSGFEFSADFPDQCTQHQADAVLDGEEVSLENKENSNSTFIVDTSKLLGPGKYRIDAYCDNKTVSGDNVSFKADSLNLELDKLGDSTFYAGQKITGDISVSSSEEILSKPSNIDYESSFGNIQVDEDEGTFEVETDQEDTGELIVELQGYDAKSDAISVEEKWQKDSIKVLRKGDELRDGVKYRNFQDVNIEFRVLKNGEPYSELSADQFSFNPVDGSFSDPKGSNWFDLTYDNGKYNVNFESSPSITDEGRVVKYYDLELESADSDSLNMDIKQLKVEKDVEFSGEVRDLERSRVPTKFTAYFDDGFTEFSTSDTGQGNADFLKFFAEEKADRMVMDFPEADFELKNFNLVREYPRGQEKEIRYNYYSKFGQSGLDSSEVPSEIRPVNLVAVESDYDYDDEDPDVTRAILNFDSSQVEDIRDLVVYECTYWMFERETCSTSWNEKDVRPLGQSSVSVPIDAYDEQFGGTVNVLWNSYVVGVPRGVGSSLSLQNGLDVSSGSLQSGEELTVSGTVVDSSTGEGVNGSDVSLKLVSDENTVNFEDDDADSDGSFEFSKEVEEAGEYTVEFSAEKDPYESFGKESSQKVNVFYETGLTVSSESDIDLQMDESSDIEFEVKNSGQSEVENIELEVGGIDEEHYSLNPGNIASLGTDERTKTVTLSLDRPEEYCSDPCTSPPTISLSASGTSAGETVENSASVYTNIPSDNQQQTSEETEEPDQTDQQNQNQSSLDVPGPSEVSQMTGDFIERQSDMNLALGIIMIFGLVLAATVKKRKEGNNTDRGRGMGGRVGMQSGMQSGGSVQRPDVSPNRGDKQSVESEETVEDAGSEDDEIEESREVSGNDGEEFKCETCGDEFETRSGLKLHEQALH